MFTVPQNQTPRKVFRATLRDEAGVLAKVDGDIAFLDPYKESKKTGGKSAILANTR